MKSLRSSAVVTVLVVTLSVLLTDNVASQGPVNSDPHVPPFVNIDGGEYLRLRAEHTARLRGLPYPDPSVRIRAGQQALQQIEQHLAAGRPSPLTSAWTPIGPAPIPNGQTTSISTAVSGRVTAIDVHPTNPNIAYVGTAQGGLYRTLDGGTTWTPLMDSAQSLAIGAVTIDPADPTIVFVGTGEGNLSLDSFFGVGLYRITSADTSPVLEGPFETRIAGTGTTASNGHAFLGTSINKIVVDPADHNRIYVGNTAGGGGLSGDEICCGGTTPPSAFIGLYFSSNAQAATPQFSRVSTIGGGLFGVTDIVFEPGSSANLLVGAEDLNGGFNTSGIFRSTNANVAPGSAPAFSQVVPMASSILTVKFAINKIGSTVNVVAATGENSFGQLRKSTDGGATWPTTITSLGAPGSGFCGGQCFYDIAVAMDPGDPNIIYLGGSGNATNGSVLVKSTNGTSFSRIDTGLHADSHALKIAPSNTATVYTGNDGGIWKSVNSGGAWTSLNNTTFSATQFQSIALHPSNSNFSIGGTQDNGTNMFQPAATWNRVDFGDGGFSEIDQNAADTTNVTMYHTYFNQTGNLIGFARVTTVASAMDGSWSFLGCGGVANGIGCADSVLFYAPMALGPGVPNTVYFGTDRLYRSANKGDTMTVVSQAPLVGGQKVSAIGISPQDDNFRMVGLTNGKIFGTATGANPLTDITGAGMPPKYVGRMVFDPTNKNTAYVSFNGYGVAAGQHVWKTTNFNGSPPTWIPAGNGIPDVPVNALAVDPANSSNVYAGTDIGVYASTDGGANWTAFGTGLPVVAVFDMAIQNPNRILRIATHGRGMWQLGLGVAPGSLVYKSLEPCRIMDTRNATAGSGVQGPIAGGALKQLPGFITTGSNWGQYGQTGTLSDCGLTNPPGNAIQAVAIVITILNPNFDAFLGVSDINSLSTTLSTVALNYTHGQGLSTMYIVPQVSSNTIYFALPAALSAHLIFDVVGYYVLSDATALQCTTLSSAAATIGAVSTGSATSPACGAGYALASGSCDSDSFSMKLVADKAAAQTWVCSANNSGGAPAHLTATVNCCRVPGK